MKIRLLMLLLILSCAAGFSPATASAAETQKMDFIKVWYDETGTPHIVANNTYGAFFGYGYCLARDRLFQLEVLRRSTEGTLAEVFGSDFIEADFMARRDRVSFAELEEGLKACASDFTSALAAFTNGINRAIEDGRAGKYRFDEAFTRAEIIPTPFSQLQILNIFAGTMAARYNDFTLELDNLHLLNNLVRKFGARTASEIFEDVVFYEDPKVYTTLGTVEYFKPGFRHIPRLAPTSDQTGPLHSQSLRTRKRNETLKKVGVPDKSGSYGAVLSRLPEGEHRAYLLGGPQMGYFKPSAVYSVGLHTPEFDIVGTTPAGYIFLMFAANREIAFTATAGVGNLVDLLSLKQDPADPEMLLGSGFSLQKSVRKEQIFVKGSAAPVFREVIETAAGPVTAVEGDVYYVKHRAWKGRVVESYAGWFASTFADNLKDWLNASDRNALSINWLGADRSGNIAYVHCGLGKNRRSFGDDRLPVNTPTDFSQSEERLAGINPPTGFFVNWNCPPAAGYRDGDLQSGWAADQRSRYIADHIEQNKALWSLDYLIQLDKDIAFMDQRAYFFKDFLLTFIDTHMLSPVQKNGLEAMRNWDNRRADDNGDGKFDNPGAGIFDRFFNDLYGAVFAEKLGDFIWMAGSDPTWTQSSILARAILGQTTFDYLNGKPAVELCTRTFMATMDALTPDGFHLPEFDCPPMEFAGINHVGAPTMSENARTAPFMNRGSDIQIVELSPEGIKVFGCMPPGNSASGKFATDQMQDFKEFRFRSRALTMPEVRALNGRFMVIQP